MTEHSWSTQVLTILILFVFPVGLIYLFVKWKRRCPICHTPEKALLPPLSRRETHHS